MNQEVKNSLWRRFFDNKKLLRWCIRLYLFLWIVSALFRFLILVQGDKYFQAHIGLETVALRAVFLKESEYETTPTVDQWVLSGNKEIPYRYRGFCQVHPDGSLYAILPDNQETPAVIKNCTFIKADEGSEVPTILRWLHGRVSFVETILSIILQPFIWNYVFIYDIYLPADYKESEELFSRILAALEHPCKYSFKNDNKKLNSDDASTNYLCTDHNPMPLLIHILPEGTTQYERGMNYLYSFQFTSNP